MTRVQRQICGSSPAQQEHHADNDDHADSDGDPDDRTGALAVIGLSRGSG